MKTLKCLILLLFILIPSQVGAEEKAYSSKQLPLLIQIFEYAKKHDLKALEELDAELSSNSDRIIVIARTVALYIASPGKYEDRFVEMFPVEYDGLMLILYSKIEAEKLTPRFLFSVDELGAIALRGNIAAIKKALMATIHSDGVVAESFCEVINGLIQNQLENTINSLSNLEKRERDKIYLCLDATIIGNKVGDIKRSIKRLSLTAEERQKIVCKEILFYLERKP